MSAGLTSEASGVSQISDSVHTAYGSLIVVDSKLYQAINGHCLERKSISKESRMLLEIWNPGSTGLWTDDNAWLVFSRHIDLQSCISVYVSRVDIGAKTFEHLQVLQSRSVRTTWDSRNISGSVVRRVSESQVYTDDYKMFRIPPLPSTRIAAQTAQFSLVRILELFPPDAENFDHMAVCTPHSISLL